MNKVNELVLIRFPKFVAGNLIGTLVDTLILWLFSHFVFHRYFGKVIISPIISFEFAVFANFLVSYYLIWRDRVEHHSGKSFAKHYLAYNLSCTGGFFIKMGMLVLIQALSKWDVVICNLLALFVSGGFNFAMGELVVFKKKRV